MFVSTLTSNIIEIALSSYDLVAPKFTDPMLYRELRFKVVGGDHDSGHSHGWLIDDYIIGKQDFDH